MKKTFLFLFIVAVVFSACKSKTPKELIVNKWKITDISMQGQTMPDSIKNKIMQGTMEFTQDGKYMITGMEADKSGTYVLSDDGKTLTVTTNGAAEMNDVMELSKSKLVISDKTNGSKLTATPK